MNRSLRGIALAVLASSAHPGATTAAGAEDPFWNSPFGFHPATVRGPDPYRHAGDIGVRCDRSGLYFMWGLVQRDPASPRRPTTRTAS